MEIGYTTEALKDIEYIKRHLGKKYQDRVTCIISDIEKHPQTGIGKPEALKYELAGCWSRRIDRKNRLVYSFTETEVTIYSLLDHY